MLGSSIDILYIGGTALVTCLASLLPVGLASRFSIFSVDEEAPPWVSLTWSALHSAANGVFSTLTLQLAIQVRLKVSGSKLLTDQDSGRPSSMLWFLLSCRTGHSHICRAGYILLPYCPGHVHEDSPEPGGEEA